MSGWGTPRRGDSSRRTSSGGWGRRDPNRRRDDESTSGASSGWGRRGRAQEGEAEDDEHQELGRRPIRDTASGNASAVGGWGDRLSWSRAMAARAREEREDRLADTYGWQEARSGRNRALLGLEEDGAPHGSEPSGSGGAGATKHGWGAVAASPKLSSHSDAVPSNVLSAMRSLLFSPLCSDIRFVCEDGGTVLHAHKCILAASSEYFATAFQGPWGSASVSAPATAGAGQLKDDTGGGDDAERDGSSAMIWPTSNSPQIMRAVLSFVYTGDVSDRGYADGKTDSPGENVDPRALLSVAHEYRLAPLLEEAEMMCFRDLTVENWLETLQLAHLYECDALKVLCFNFCVNRAVEILTDPDVAALAAANQELWGELREVVTGGGRAAGGGSSGGGEEIDAGAREGRKRKR